MNKLVYFITVLFFFIGDALSVPYDKSMPMWIVQMGNRENSPFSSRGVVISHNGDSGNFYSQSMDDKMMDYMNNQRIRNSRLPLVELNGQFYYFEKYFKTNYFKAMHFCKEHGMDLLSIETGIENMEIIAYLKKHFPKVDHVWTSGTDQGEEGAFVWMSTGKPVNFTSWGQGLPDNSGKIEHCLEIIKAGVENYFWNDRNCISDYFFICEVNE